MARKQMSEEQKQAARERLAKAREAKKNKNPEINTQFTSVPEVPVPQDHSAQDPNVSDLQRQIEELKQMMAVNSAFLQGQQSVGGANIARGRVIGTVERYSTRLSDYPDPRERLSEEPRLSRIAFPQNYTLDWSVSETQYETKDGVNTKEPKFHLSLNRIVMDESGEPTNGRYGICQMVFFEDPSTAMVMAHENGLKVDESNELEFLNEMRYLRMRDWLFECFWPKVSSSSQSNKREMVIGGKTVDYFEVSSENNASIPFDQLSKKVG